MGCEGEGSAQRLLVVGDNHGDAESLQTVVKETAGEEFDFVVHTGDVTDAYHRGVDTAADQLRDLEPLFETLAELSELVYIYGNRDSERVATGTSRPIRVVARHASPLGHLR